MKEVEYDELKSRDMLKNLLIKKKKLIKFMMKIEDK